MILPKNGELDQIPGVEIAGFSFPAAEVGGNYYDILQLARSQTGQGTESCADGASEQRNRSG